MSTTWGSAFGSATVDAMQVYEELFVPPFFTPWAELLLDELDLRADDVLLDVACGPGTVARVAAKRVARVTACDLSAAMLAVALAKPPVEGAPIEYVEAPADDLPVESESFDVATCQQGLQFFPDPVAALRELRRALKPGGRAGVAVWTDIEDSPVFARLADAVEEVAGPELATRYRSGPWGQPSAEWLAHQLAEAGFEDVRVERYGLTVRFDRRVPATLAASGIAADLPADATPLVEAFERRAADLVQDGVIVSETASNVAFARREA